MDGAEVEKSTGASWGIVTEFLRSTADALAENPQLAAVAPEAGRSDLASSATGLVRYERFAQLLSEDGICRLRDAASTVAGYCQARLAVAPTAQELEWIISVAVNEPI